MDECEAERKEGERQWRMKEGWNMVLKFMLLHFARPNLVERSRSPLLLLCSWWSWCAGGLLLLFNPVFNMDVTAIEMIYTEERATERRRSPLLLLCYASLLSCVQKLHVERSRSPLLLLCEWGIYALGLTVLRKSQNQNPVDVKYQGFWDAQQEAGVTYLHVGMGLRGLVWFIFWRRVEQWMQGLCRGTLSWGDVIWAYDRWCRVFIVQQWVGVKAG